MIPTEAEPTGDQAARPPRMTIGRGMIGIALVAVVLGLGRTGQYVGAIVLGLSLGAGWAAWVVGRWRPQAALCGLGGVYAAGFALTVATTLVLGPGDFVLAFFLTAAPVLTLAYPTILGFGLAWLAHARATGRADRDALYTDDLYTAVVVATLCVAPVVALAAWFWIGTTIHGLAH